MQSNRQPEKRKASILLWAGVGALFVIPIVRFFLFEIDHQYANLATGGIGIVALGCISLAWLRRATNRQRLGFLAIVVAGLSIFSACFELKGFTGETLPVFGRRAWLASQPKAISNQQVAEDSPMAKAASNAVFRQFLGNDRNGVVDAPEFNTRWSEHPPKILWKKTIGSGWSGFAVGHSMAYTMYQDDDHETIAGFDLVTGEMKWSQRVPGKHFEALGGLGPRATPTLHEDLLIAQTATGVVLCCNAIDGEVVWKQDVLRMGFDSKESSEAFIKWGRSASPLVVSSDVGAQVVVPLGGKPNSDAPITLVSFELQTGKVRWKSGNAQIGYASPAWIDLGTTKQIVSVNENLVTGHDPNDGQVLWSTDWVSHSNADACASQPVSLGDGRVLLGKGYAQGSKMIRIDTKSIDQEMSAVTLWQNTRILKTKFTNAIYFDGLLYALSDGVLECVKPEDGKRVWRAGRFGQGQLLVVNGQLLVTSEDGRIVLANRADGKTIYEQPVLDGVTWNYPAVAGPFLLVRNGNEMACLYSPVTSQSSQLDATPTAQ